MVGRAQRMAVRVEASTDQRILEAATTLFYEKGYHGTTMREVAAAVGLKAGSLYNHYPGKEDLLFRIAYDTMEELLEGGRAAIAPYGGPRDQLRALVIWHVTYHAERRFQARVADEQLHALEADRRDEVVRLRDAYEQLFKDVLIRGRDECAWQVPSASVITFGIGGMCTTVDTWFRDDGALSGREIADMYGDFILAALEPRAAAPVLVAS